MLVRIWQKIIDEERIRVFVFAQLENNYSYIIETRAQCLVVDPAESEEILNYIQAENLDLKAVLLTHYHEDHIRGVNGILEKLQTQVIGPFDENLQIANSIISNQEELIIGPFSVLALETPGHTTNHLCYYVNNFQILFSGDMIFPCGCGKIMQGLYEKMIESLKVLKSLPKDTYIFSGHEYSIENLKFALSIEPERKDIEERLDLIIKKEQYPIPTTIDLELKINPFFRIDDLLFQKKLNCEDASELEVLIKLRELRENQ